MSVVLFDLGDLLEDYRFLKLDARRMGAILPRQDYEQTEGGDPCRSKWAMEEKFCIIGDIEKFCDHYHKIMKRKVPLDCLRDIFEMKFCDDETCYGIAEYFKYASRKGRRVIVPSLKHREAIRRILKDMLHNARPYYERKGLIGRYRKKYSEI